MPIRVHGILASFVMNTGAGGIERWIHVFFSSLA